jgi:hypothetical protein
MTFSRILAIAALVMGVASCTTTSSKEPLGPAPKNAEQQAKTALRASLKNPFDVKEVRISRPTTVVYDIGLAPQWTVCMSLYARNGFNALTKGEYFIAFKNGVVSNVVSISDYNFIQSQAGQCGSMSATTL